MLSEKIKRIVILTQDYLPSADGITTWCYEIGKNLENIGFEVIVITKTYDGFDGKQLGELITIRLDNTRWKNHRNRRVKKAIKEFLSDDTVFLCANWKMAVPCYLSSFSGKINYFVAVHGLDAIEGRFVNKILQRRTLNSSCGAISVSHYTAGLLEKANLSAGLPQTVINNGVDTDRFKPVELSSEFIEKYNIKPGIRILSLGRLIERKGFDMTIRAIALMKNKDVNYYLAGKGHYRPRLEEIAIENNVSGRVFFMGLVPDEDIVSVYNSGDIFAMPSRDINNDVEGFGITYIEAAACGVPSVGGKNCGAEDAIVHRQTGLLVDPNLPEEIAEALDILAADEKMRIEMGDNAKQRVEQSLTWRKITDQITEFMSSCL